MTSLMTRNALITGDPKGHVVLVALLVANGVVAPGRGLCVTRKTISVLIDDVRLRTARILWRIHLEGIEIGRVKLVLKDATDVGLLSELE
ncbi:MAG: hypothetical protein ACRDT7_16650 [Microbacterium sp.]